MEPFTLWSWVLGGVGVARVMGLSHRQPVDTCADYLLEYQRDRARMA